MKLLNSTERQVKCLKRRLCKLKTQCVFFAQSPKIRPKTCRSDMQCWAGANGTTETRTDGGVFSLSKTNAIKRYLPCSGSVCFFAFSNFDFQMITITIQENINQKNAYNKGLHNTFTVCLAGK